MSVHTIFRLTQTAYSESEVNLNLTQLMKSLTITLGLLDVTLLKEKANVTYKRSLLYIKFLFIMHVISFFADKIIFFLKRLDNVSKTLHT